MGRMNQGNWGAFLNAVPQGAETEQRLESNDAKNTAYRAGVTDPAVRQNQSDIQQYNTVAGMNNTANANTQGYQQQQPTQQSGALFDPVRERIHGLLQAAGDKYRSVFGGQQTPHAVGPAAQQTTQAPGNAAASRPGPSTSDPAAQGIPGATGAQVADAEMNPGRANGGAIPGRKLTGIRAKKAKPGNQAKPTAGDKQVADVEAGQQMPPRNTEPGAGISNQDPDLSAADGKFIQKAIKHPGALHRDLGVPQGEKIPKSKIKAAEHSDNPKTAKRAQLADTMSKFKDGGMPKLPKLEPGAAPEPKPAPNMVSQEVNQDGMRHYLGKTIKRYADGDQVEGPPSPDKVPTPAGVKDADWPGLVPVAARAAKDFYTGTVEPVVNRISSDVGAVGGAANRAIWGPDQQPTPSPGKGASPPQQNAAPGAPRAGAQEVPVIDQREATNRERSGGYGPDGKPVGPAMVDTEDQGPALPPRHAGAAPASAPQAAGPPSPDKIDFSQVQVDHSQIPTTTTDDWKRLEAASALHYAAHGMSSGEAMRKANADVTGMQHDNFMDYLRQGAALDAAGNKQGAMAAYKTAYQYFPTGHDMHFGVGPDGNIVAFGVNEQTGQPVQNGAVKLDQQSVHGIITHFANPENFVNEGIRMQTLANETQHLHAGQIPLERAQATEALQRGEYFQGANPTRLAAAEARANATAGKFADPHTEKYYQSGLTNVIDPQDHGDALGLAAQIEGKLTHPPSDSDRAQILGTVQHLFSPNVSPEERQQWMSSHGFQIGPQMPARPTTAGIPGRNGPDPTYSALYGH